MATNNSRKAGALAAIIGSAAAAGAIAFTAGNEGVSTTPYSDKIAGGVSTVCAGDTVAVQRRYSYAECMDMLDTRMAQYAAPVKAMTPGFDSLTDGQKIAAVDLAYNIGVPNYQHSTLRRMYGAKQFPSACDQFLKWRFVAGKDCAVVSNQCIGIMRRRQAERAACLGETT